MLNLETDQADCLVQDSISEWDSMWWQNNIIALRGSSLKRW